MNKPNIKLLSNLYFKIGFIQGYNQKEKKDFLKKEIFLGDTDIFIKV